MGIEVYNRAGCFNFLRPDGWTSSGKCPDGPYVSEQRRTNGWHDGYRPSGAQQSQNDRIKMIEFFILRKVRRGISRSATLEDCDLFRNLVDRLSWKAILKGKGVQENFLQENTFFKKIPQIQEQAISMCQKMSQWERRLACLNRELLQELR